MKRGLSIAWLIAVSWFSTIAIAADSYLPVIEEAPSFSLTNVNGRAVSSAQLRGNVIVLTFMYTHCSGVCPLVTERMHRIADKLDSVGMLGEGVKLVSISFDPARDTPRWLKTYSEASEIDANEWMFLSGTPAETSALLKRYDFGLKREPTGDYDHVSRVYLIDVHGRIRQIYSLSFLDAGSVLRDVGSLVADAQSGPRDAKVASASSGQ